MKRWMQLLVGGAVATAIACSADATSPVIGDGSQSKGALSGGNDSTGGNSGGGDSASHGAAVSVTATPQNLVMPVGNYGQVLIVARDARGANFVVRPQDVSWQSSNPAVAAVVGDSGVISAKAVGTAKIYATYNGLKDSATVLVIPTPPPPPPPPPPAAEFNLTVTVFGQLAGADTARTERVAGATVSLTRIAADSSSAPVDAGSATTDASGEVKFTRLAGGFYTITVTPPTGSPYAKATYSIATPRDANISVPVKLMRR